MAEITFYANPGSRSHLLELMRYRSCRFLLDRNYDTDNPSIAEFIKETDLSWFDVNPRVWVLGPFVEHVEFNQMETGRYSGTFSVNPRVGGPLIQAVMPRSTTIEGQEVALPWTISLPSSFRPYRNSRDVAVPVAAKMVFDDIAKSVKGESRRISAGSRKAWVFGSGPLTLTGTDKLLVEGHVVSAA